jgi:8-oxo-dGTP pyrophosphatase MutT (NUDIX family)
MPAASVGERRMTEPEADFKRDDSALPRRRGSIAVIRRGEQFLVIRRSQTVVAPGMYCFPGGGIEGRETEAEALCRELREELNVEIRPVKRVWWNETRWNTELFWWQAELTAGATLLANPAEVESIHWMTAAELLALDNLLDSNRDFLEALARGEIELE